MEWNSLSDQDKRCWAYQQLAGMDGHVVDKLSMAETLKNFIEHGMKVDTPTPDALPIAAE